MIIDIHAHTFPAKIASHALGVLSSNSHTRPFTDGTIPGLSASMRESGITFSVIQPVATKPEQVTRINNTAIKINSEGESVRSFGGIHPFFDDCYGELLRISESGIKGVKIHPVYQGLNVDDERYARILKFAGELGLIVMIHAGWDIGFPGDDSALPERIARVLDVCGDVRVILAHMGGWRCWNESAKLFAGRENVYVDTAFSLGRFYPNDDVYYQSDDECEMLSDDEFVSLVRAFGSERVIFGTDSPWSSQKDCVKEFMSLPLDDNEKQNILCNNASKLLGFNTRKILSEENLCQAKC